MAATFPRSYIVERIDARLASIARQDVEDTALAAKGKDATRKLWLEWLTLLERHAQEVVAAVFSVAGAPDLDDLTGEEVRERAEAIKVAPPQNPRERWDRNASPAQRDLGQLVSAGTSAETRLTASARERVSLEHVRAYLQGTPVDTFTKTDLRDLGLLDVIKFRLELR